MIVYEIIINALSQTETTSLCMRKGGGWGFFWSHPLGYYLVNAKLFRNTLSGVKAVERLTFCKLILLQ